MVHLNDIVHPHGLKITAIEAEPLINIKSPSTTVTVYLQGGGHDVQVEVVEIKLIHRMQYGYNYRRYDASQSIREKTVVDSSYQPGAEGWLIKADNAVRLDFTLPLSAPGGIAGYENDFSHLALKQAQEIYDEGQSYLTPNYVSWDWFFIEVTARVADLLVSPVERQEVRVVGNENGYI